MKFGWTQIGKLALAVVSIAVPQIGVAEAAIVGAFKGQDKLAAVRTAVLQGILAAEDITDKELINEVEVQASIDSVISAIVHLQNTVESVKQARRQPQEAPTQPPAPTTPDA